MARQSVRLNNASPDLQVTFGKSVFFFDDLGWVYYRSHNSHYICHMSIYKLYNHILYIINYNYI